MCGHDHCKSVIIKGDSTLIISGNGGEVYHGSNTKLSNMIDSKLNYFSPSLGFAILKSKKGSLDIYFYNDKGFREYKHTVKK